MMTSVRDAKEAKLLHAYGKVKQSNVIVQNILGDHVKAGLLYHALKRQVFFILQRSQDYEDGEVTIYDRALVKLWNEGYPLKHPGLLELFVDEFMAAKQAHSVAEKETIVSAYLEAQSFRDHAKQNPPAEDSVSKNGDSDQTPAHENVQHAQAEVKGEVDVSLEAQVNEGRLTKLIHVYHCAKADYYISDANKTGFTDRTTDKFSNVRFLRDTAENLLRCFHSDGLDNHYLLPEVERVAAASREHAERLAGGRKRIFENPGEEKSFGRHRDNCRDNRRDKRQRRGDYYRPE